MDACVYRYRFLDATFSESCRLKDPKPHAKPLYKSKIMGHPVGFRFCVSREGWPQTTLRAGVWVCVWWYWKWVGR